MLRMCFKEQQFSLKTIPKLVRTGGKKDCYGAPLLGVVY